MTEQNAVCQNIFVFRNTVVMHLSKCMEQNVFNMVFKTSFHVSPYMDCYQNCQSTIGLLAVDEFPSLILTDQLRALSKSSFVTHFNHKVTYDPKYQYLLTDSGHHYMAHK